MIAEYNYFLNLLVTACLKQQYNYAEYSGLEWRCCICDIIHEKCDFYVFFLEFMAIILYNDTAKVMTGRVAFIGTIEREWLVEIPMKME